MNQGFKRALAGVVFVAFMAAGVGAGIAAEKKGAKAAKEEAVKPSKEATQAANQATKETAKIKTIFDYKAEINMSDEQEAKIKQELSDLEKEIRVMRAKLTIIDSEAQTLLEKDGDMTQLKNKVKEAYDIQASMRIADIEASRKINAVLRPEQLKKWKEIQAASRNK
jgi:hypothetical protein